MSCAEEVPLSMWQEHLEAHDDKRCGPPTWLDDWQALKDRMYAEEHPDG